MLSESISRFGLLFKGIDMNGDGKFTIMDLPSHLWEIILAPGHKYQEIFAGNAIGRFLEMSGSNPSQFWSIVLTIFSYFMFFGGLSALFQKS